MHDDDIPALLKDDLDALAQTLERDRTAQRIIYRIGARKRARLGVVAFAGGIGAAAAASQFTDVATLFAQAVEGASAGAADGYASTQFLATLMIAAALAATAFVMRREA